MKCPVCENNLTLVYEDKIDHIVCESFLECKICEMYSTSFSYGIVEEIVNGSRTSISNWVGEGSSVSPKTRKKIIKDAKKRYSKTKNKFVPKRGLSIRR